MRIPLVIHVFFASFSCLRLMRFSVACDSIVCDITSTKLSNLWSRLSLDNEKLDDIRLLNLSFNSSEKASGLKILFISIHRN